MVLRERIESYGLSKAEFPGLSSAQLGEVGSATECLAQVVGERADVGSRRNFGDEAGAISRYALDFEAMDDDFDRLHLYWFVFARKFVGRDAVDFLRRVDGRQLQNASGEGGQLAMDLTQARLGAGNRPNGFSFSVVGVGRETETYFPFIDFRSIVKELR